LRSYYSFSTLFLWAVAVRVYDEFINSNWQFAVTNNRLTFASFHIVFLSFCRSWENVTPAPGFGIQNSAPAPASEKPPELRQNSGSGNSGAQH
jgi:hypothetical protein